MTILAKQWNGLCDAEREVGTTPAGKLLRPPVGRWVNIMDFGDFAHDSVPQGSGAGSLA